MWAELAGGQQRGPRGQELPGWPAAALARAFRLAGNLKSHFERGRRGEGTSHSLIADFIKKNYYLKPNSNYHHGK